MDNEMLRRLAESERLNKIAVITNPDQNTGPAIEAYDTLRSLREEDSDFDVALRDRLLELAKNQKGMR